jgi:hypothetical protein
LTFDCPAKLVLLVGLNAATTPTNRLRAITERFTSAVVERDVVAGYRIIQAIGDV